MAQSPYPILAALLLSACASYGTRGLQPGISTLADVRAALGNPAMQWQNPDGSQQLSFPRGPLGLQSYMAVVDAKGSLQSIRNVLDSASFARIHAGMTQDEVLRTLGPSYPGWTVTFPARRELVWEWRYCDDWSQTARFDVLFDQDSGKVRSTLSLPEDCGDRPCWCGH